MLAVGSAIESEPDWAYLTDLLGTRADGAAVAAAQRDDQGRRPRARGEQVAAGVLDAHATAIYNFKDNVRGLSHVLATVDENTYTGGTMKALADHPVAWCKDYQGGRSFYTERRRQRRLRRRRRAPTIWRARSSGPRARPTRSTATAARPCWPTTSRRRSRQPPNLNEPIGFDVLPDGRVLQTARGGQLRLHDPKDGSTKVDRHAAGLHQQRGRPLRPGDRQRLRHQPLGLPLLRAARPSSTSSSPTARRRRSRRRRTARRRPTAPSLCAWDPYVGLLPALALQVRRRRNADARPRRASRRSCGSPTTAARAATSPVTSTSTSTTTCGWSRATTRRPAAATRAASRRTTT